MAQFAKQILNIISEAISGGGGVGGRGGEAETLQECS